MRLILFASAANGSREGVGRKPGIKFASNSMYHDVVQFHTGSTEYLNTSRFSPRRICQRLSFNSTLVRLSTSTTVADILALVKGKRVSIPHWFDLSTSTCQMPRSSMRKDEARFNSTLVRLSTSTDPIHYADQGLVGSTKYSNARKFSNRD